MKIRSLAAALLLGMALSSGAGGAQHGTDFHLLMQKEFDAWSSIDLDKIAPFYAQAPDCVFYDLKPLKFNGWAEYAEAMKKTLPGLASVKFTFNNDAQTHQERRLAWGTATVHMEIVTKGGNTQSMDARWTAIWEKQGKNWVIVHEHFSAPSI
jgi:ketosteroid isomerase-like protein